ncbi:MAG: hypothetical protein ACRCSR_09500, partial [Bacteroidales bacterium]
HKYTKHLNIKTDHLGKSKFVVHSKKIKKKKSLIYGELQNYRGKVGLIRLGINKSKAWEFANTRKGYWHIANSPILNSSVTNDRLKQSGYIFFSDYYRKVANVN